MQMFGATHPNNEEEDEAELRSATVRTYQPTEVLSRGAFGFRSARSTFSENQRRKQALQNSGWACPQLKAYDVEQNVHIPHRAYHPLGEVVTDPDNLLYAQYISKGLRFGSREHFADVKDKIRDNEKVAARQVQGEALDDAFKHSQHTATAVNGAVVLRDRIKESESRLKGVKAGLKFLDLAKDPGAIFAPAESGKQDPFRTESVASQASAQGGLNPSASGSSLQALGAADDTVGHNASEDAVVAASEMQIVGSDLVSSSSSARDLHVPPLNLNKLGASSRGPTSHGGRHSELGGRHSAAPSAGAAATTGLPPPAPPPPRGPLLPPMSEPFTGTGYGSSRKVSTGPTASDEPPKPHAVLLKVLRLSQNTPLDPFQQLELTRRSFHQMRDSLNARLQNDIERQDAERPATFRRKFTAFGTYVDPGSGTGQDGEKRVRFKWIASSTIRAAACTSLGQVIGRAQRGNDPLFLRSTHSDRTLQSRMPNVVGYGYLTASNAQTRVKNRTLAGRDEGVDSDIHPTRSDMAASSSPVESRGEDVVVHEEKERAAQGGEVVVGISVLQQIVVNEDEDEVVRSSAREALDFEKEKEKERKDRIRRRMSVMVLPGGRTPDPFGFPLAMGVPSSAAGAMCANLTIPQLAAPVTPLSPQPLTFDSDQVDAVIGVAIGLYVSRDRDLHLSPAKEEGRGIRRSRSRDLYKGDSGRRMSRSDGHSDSEGDTEIRQIQAIQQLGQARTERPGDSSRIAASLREIITARRRFRPKKPKKQGNLVTDTPRFWDARVDLETMRLEAEAEKVKQLINAHKHHPWYVDLLAMVTEGGRDIALPEQQLINQVKRAVELGVDFGKAAFYTLVKTVKVADHKNQDIQNIFAFLREVVKLSYSEYAKWLLNHKLPLPPQPARPPSGGMLATRKPSTLRDVARLTQRRVTMGALEMQAVSQQALQEVGGT